ncbi:MAG: SBBP repeat-containing protein [Candidatus Thorarchaeota archaeon]
MRNSRAILILVVFMIMSVSLVGDYRSTTQANPAENRISWLAGDSEFSTYFGGLLFDQASRITLDLDGNIFLKFVTSSSDLPTTENAVQSSHNGSTDGYVAKFSRTGNLLYATYLGGSDDEHIAYIAVDAENNIILTGATWSDNFPLTADAYQSSHQGASDGFITIIAPNGSLLYSTFFGGGSHDRIQRLKFDSLGHNLIFGYTTSTGLGTSEAYQPDLAGGYDAFVGRLSDNMTQLEMFSYFGGSSTDYGWNMELDSEGNFVFSGETMSANYPTTAGALNDTYSGSEDTMLTILSNNGSELIYSSYIGGTGRDWGGATNIDSEGNIILTGPTKSTDFPVLNALNPEFPGVSQNTFAMKFASNGTLLFSTFVGATLNELFWDATLDEKDNIVFIGTTNSDDYPLYDATQPTRGGGNDAFITVLSSDGQSIIGSTYLGGTYAEKGEGVTVSPNGEIFICGTTSSEDFPISDNAYQTELAGSADIFITQILFDEIYTPSDLSDLSIAIYYSYDSYFDPRVNESRTALMNMFTWMNATINVVDKQNILDGALWGHEILAIPEGLGPTIESKLGDDAIEIIRDWVGAGGSYVGVRGSAAMAVKDSYFEGSTTQFKLALIDGISYEVLGLPTQSMIQLAINQDCTEPDMSDEPESITICSITGRYFEAYDRDDITIVANYTHINQPAMITSRYGNGTIFLSSPHFEYEEDNNRDGTDYMDDFEDPDSEWPLIIKMCRWLVEESPTVQNITWPEPTTPTTTTTNLTTTSNTTTIATNETTTVNTTTSTTTTATTTTPTSTPQPAAFPIEMMIIGGGIALVVIVVIAVISKKR